MNFTAFHRGGTGSPLVLLHGFTDTWRCWELVLPGLELQHDVLAPTLLGHAGAAGIQEPFHAALLADEVERQMDDAGFETAHIAGNSLGGYVALELAARGRARTVVALAPAGGWAAGDGSFNATLDHFITMQALLKTAAPHADQIVATEAGRRRSTAMFTENFAHIPPELLAHQIVGAARCEAVGPMVASARAEGWPLDAAAVTCPIRMVWGTKDQLLPWPSAAALYRNEWFPHADWIELDGVGHCPQLDVPLETAQLILGLTSG